MNYEIIKFNHEEISVDVKVDKENNTVWLSTDEIALLYKRSKSIVSRQISSIYNEKLLEKEATVSFFATVQLEGGREISRQIKLYNLDVIIQVGYRIKSPLTSIFKDWCLDILNKKERNSKTR